MKAITSPPTLALRASLSVNKPFDVEIIAVPYPLKTLGNFSADEYTFKPGFETFFKTRNC